MLFVFKKNTPVCLQLETFSLNHKIMFVKLRELCIMVHVHVCVDFVHLIINDKYHAKIGNIKCLASYKLFFNEIATSLVLKGEGMMFFSSVLRKRQVLFLIILMH